MNEFPPVDLIEFGVTVLLGALLFALWLRSGRQISRYDQNNKEVLAQFEAAADRIEKIFREESRVMRDEAQVRGRSLREEVGGKIQGFGDSIQKRVEGLGQQSEDRFTKFGESQERRSKELHGQVTESLSAIQQELQVQLSGFRKDNAASAVQVRQESAKQAKEMQEAVTNSLRRSAQEAKENASLLAKTLKEGAAEIALKTAGLTESNEKKQDALRSAVEQRLDKLREENAEKIEQMRRTVDEKLQGTLEKRLGESFKVVSDRLEKVHQGLGEMQSLASGVGDLKRALTNVKLRGGWAEVQLGALLEEMLTPDQYEKNAKIKAHSQEVVEYAVRLPGQDEDGVKVLLPIDAKFPHEDYDRLVEAMEMSDAEAMEKASKQLEARIRSEAKRISEKYIEPPITTDFAILFLPTEGLFAEVMRKPGLAHEIQQRHRVMLTGPTTLGALLNSLQMGFRTLAIQKRSSQVWQVLGEAKAEFEKYGDVWDKVKRQLVTVTNSVDEAGRRTRAVKRKLRDVEVLEPAGEAAALLDLPGESSERKAED